MKIPNIYDWDEENIYIYTNDQHSLNGTCVEASFNY